MLWSSATFVHQYKSGAWSKRSQESAPEVLGKAKDETLPSWPAPWHDGPPGHLISRPGLAVVPQTMPSITGTDGSTPVLASSVQSQRPVGRGSGRTPRTLGPNPCFNDGLIARGRACTFQDLRVLPALRQLRCTAENFLHKWLLVSVFLCA